MYAGYLLIGLLLYPAIHVIAATHAYSLLPPPISFLKNTAQALRRADRVQVPFRCRYRLAATKEEVHLLWHMTGRNRSIGEELRKHRLHTAHRLPCERTNKHRDARINASSSIFPPIVFTLFCFFPNYLFFNMPVSSSSSFIHIMSTITHQRAV